MPLAGPPSPASLAEISRNTSVISSSSSSSSSTSSLVDNDRSFRLRLPIPVRPARTFAAPRSASDVAHSQSQFHLLPGYIQRELGITNIPTAASAPPLHRDSGLNLGPNPRPRFNSTQDFDFGEILGHGSFSTVIQAKGKKSGKAYAIKVLDKAHLQRHNQRKTAYAEKEALVVLGLTHPGIVGLHSTFSDAWSLYFVLDLLPNGDIRALIARYGSLSLKCTRYYIAQLTDALAFMHLKGVMHRDIKPENLLLDSRFRLALADFGTAKVLPPLSLIPPQTEPTSIDTPQTTNSDVPPSPSTEPANILRHSNTFVGTPQYYSPELLAHSHTSPASDLWALGCVLFELYTGTFAFQGQSPLLTWRLIKALQYTIPEGFDEDARDLLSQLITLVPEQRLGAGGTAEVNGMRQLKAHRFFNTIEWEQIWEVPHPPLESGLKQPKEPITIPESDSELGAQLREERMLDQDDDEIAWAKDAKIAAYLPGLRHANHAGVNGNGSADVEADVEVNGTIDEVSAEVSQEMHKFPRVAQDDTEESGVVLSYDSPGHLKADGPEQLREKSITDGSETVEGPALNGDEVSVVQPNGDANGNSEFKTPLPIVSPIPSTNQTSIPTSVPPSSEFQHLLQPNEQLFLWSRLVPEPSALSFSRLLPKILTGSIRSKPKLKERALLLTDRRVVCVEINKNMGTVKQEFTLSKSGSTRNGSSPGVIKGVECRGEKGIALLTGDKAVVYILDDKPAPETWVQQLRGLLGSTLKQP